MGVVVALACVQLATLSTGVLVVTAPVPHPVLVLVPPPVRITAPVQVAPTPVAGRTRPATTPVDHRLVPHRGRLPHRTPRERLSAALAQLPDYTPGIARWVITGGLGHWGLVNLRTGTVYLSPRIPRARWYDVVAHEWSHVLSLRPYPSRHAAFAALTAFYGRNGLELAADCMARQLGARWTFYTRCSNARWRWGARQLLAGRRV